MSDDNDPTRAWRPDDTGAWAPTSGEDATQAWSTAPTDGAIDPTPTPPAGYYVPAPDPAAVAAATPVGAALPDDRYRPEEPRRSSTGALVAVVVLLTLIAVVAVALVIVSGSGDDSPTTTVPVETSTTTSTTEPTTTTEATTTTTEATTTTTEATTTTTEAETPGG